MLEVGDNGITLSLSEVQRRQGQARVRDVLKASQVVDDLKQCEDVTSTFRVLDLTSQRLIGVSGASLGSVDQFGYPTDQASKSVKVYSQAGDDIFLGGLDAVPSEVVARNLERDS